MRLNQRENAMKSTGISRIIDMGDPTYINFFKYHKYNKTIFNRNIKLIKRTSGYINDVFPPFPRVLFFFLLTWAFGYVFFSVSCYKKL